ncbi:MAG: ATP-binding protein [Pseudomonadota bacterium]
MILGSTLVMALTMGVVLIIVRWTDSWTLAISVSTLLSLLGFWLITRWLFAADDTRIQALIDSADSLRDADFSFTIANRRDDEIGALVNAYNSMVSTLRTERQNLHQRELMLDTVIQASPLALVLTNENDHVIYANGTARQLFANGKRFAGRKFLQEVVGDQPVELREALAVGQDAMVSVTAAKEQERYHLSCSEFTLNARNHRLFLLKRLTQELNRQEVATWKKVIRLIGHELNNSLAPISSMAHSAKLLSSRGDSVRVEEVLETIAQRSQRLKEFIESYSKFAKLPSPQIQTIDWDVFFSSLKGLQPFQYEPLSNGLTGAGDPKQLEQVLINLCKNAVESESAVDDIVVTLQMRDQGTEIVVADRGKGMSDEALASALLPFYSTKREGSGLGLSLAREIVDAHAGNISLRNRTRGGLGVRIWLPNTRVRAEATKVSP